MALEFGFTDDFISYGATVRREPKVTTVRFDDASYELRMRKGLNSDLRVWEVNFPTLTIAQANDVEAFLTFHGGVDWFLWKPPRETIRRKMICRKWSREPITPKHDRISLAFEEVADIA